MRYIIFNMPDGSLWRLKADFIAHIRAKHYANLDADGDHEKFKLFYIREIEYTEKDEEELIDFLQNSMNWIDFVDIIEKVQEPPIPDYESVWMDASYTVVDV